jgi:hypothetical protein
MIIWSGKGYYVLLVAIGCQVLAMMACKTILGDATIFKTHGWPKSAALGKGDGSHYLATYH